MEKETLESYFLNSKQPSKMSHTLSRLIALKKGQAHLWQPRESRRIHRNTYTVIRKCLFIYVSTEMLISYTLPRTQFRGPSVSLFYILSIVAVTVLIGPHRNWHRRQGNRASSCDTPHLHVHQSQRRTRSWWRSNIYKKLPLDSRKSKFKRLKNVIV